MATIQERPGKTGISYRVGYYADGKFRFTPSMKNRAGAERIARIIDTQGHEAALKILNAQQDGKQMTLRQWFERHLKVKAIKLEDGTIAGYEREAARTWLPRLGDLPLDTITRDTVIDWISWQMKQPTARSIAKRERAIGAGVKTKELPPLETVAPKTVRNAHGLLSSVLDSAHMEGLITRNPAKGAPVPKDDIEEEKEIFTRPEWEAFYAAMSDDYKPFTAFLLVTGARIGEASAVRVRDLNPGASTVSIVRAWKKARQGQTMGVPKSRRSRRVVMLPDWAASLFRDQAKGKGPDDLLFTAPRGGRIFAHRYNERQWAKALEDSGIDKHLTPHSLRHTFASWQLMAGVPPQTVQHRLGHESLATTSTVYGHLLIDAQSQGVQAIEWEPPAAIEA